jgi:hypothetical protein
MADFRRWFIALAVVLLLTGLASAQVGATGSTPLVCTANATTTPTIRLEGITELVGDIVITCTGGAIIPNGTVAQQTNIIVTLPQPVTSRLLPSATIPNASEALLLIDEPNSGLPAPVTGFGPGAPFAVCPTPNTGCAENVETIAGVGGSYQTGVSTTTTSAPFSPPYNVFQGLVTGNQVTFFGVPIVPPGTTGTRVLRITNVRTNASGLTAGASVIANVSVTGFTIVNPTPIVAFAQTSLSTSAGAGSPFGQCNSQTLSTAGTLKFTELFANAFKTRVDTSVAGQSGTPAGGALVQDVPGHLYNSESGFTLAVPTSSVPAGLADSGTRLTAVFNNLPAGVRIFVSQYNVAVSLAGVPSNITLGQQNYLAAQEVTSESIADSNNSVPGSTAFTTLAPGAVGGTIPVVEITPTSGTSATASWEVIASTPTQIQSLQFAYFVTYTAAPSNNSPVAGNVTVNLRYGPASTATTATTGPIPRFLDTSKAATAASINICRTVLLFPFITNEAGFDTGIAIANTSTDPFGTPPQNGTCSLNWYGAAAPATATTTASVATSSDYANLASVLVPGFQGYMIAICNFQFAHGFAFISDVGAQKLAMGYLADVIPDPALQPFGLRIPSDSGAGANGSGENLGQ